MYVELAPVYVVARFGINALRRSLVRCFFPSFWFVFFFCSDYQTWNQFNILTENSAQELFADAASACLARRKPTYSCTLLQEYAATSILVEESGTTHYLAYFPIYLSVSLQVVYAPVCPYKTGCVCPFYILVISLYDNIQFGYFLLGAYAALEGRELSGGCVLSHVLSEGLHSSRM